MAETISDTLYGRGVAEGELRHARGVLAQLLKDRFRKLPKAVTQKIEQATSVGRLDRAILQVPRLTSLDELEL